MKDLSGFVILLLIGVLLLYLVFEFLFPFVLTYLLGTIAFFLAANVLLRRGRRHPIHLECLLKPGVSWLLTAMSIGIPAVHALLVWLLTEHGHWPFIAAGNAILPVLWTGRMLLSHRRQKAVYFAEGHDIEDLLSEVQSRGAAMGIKALAVQSAVAVPHAPQRWETVAGTDGRMSVAIRTDTGQLLDRMNALKASYAHLYEEVASYLETVRSTGMRPPPGVLDTAQQELQRLEEPYRSASSDAREVVIDSLSGADIVWDETR